MKQGQTMREYIEEQRRQYLRRQLEQCGSIQRAADCAGVSRSWFSRLLRQHGITTERVNRGNSEWQALK